MTQQQAQPAHFDIRIWVTDDGRIATSGQGNLNPVFIYAQLGVLMKKLLEQMEGPVIPLTATKTPEFKIRRLP